MPGLSDSINDPMHNGSTARHNLSRRPMARAAKHGNQSPPKRVGGPVNDAKPNQGSRSQQIGIAPGMCYAYVSPGLRR